MNLKEKQGVISFFLQIFKKEDKKTSGKTAEKERLGKTIAGK